MGNGLWRMHWCGGVEDMDPLPIPAWISNHMPSKVWDEINYPFQNFNGYTEMDKYLACHSLLDSWLLIHDKIEVKPCY